MRRIIALLHMLCAIGITVAAALLGLLNSEHEYAVGAIVIVWVNVFTMFMLMLLFSHIQKSGDYDLLNGVDTKRPFDKNLLNLTIEKYSNATVISLTIWTLTMIPLLFLRTKPEASIYLIVTVIAFTVVYVAWLIAIAVKYQNRIYTDRKE
jgi:peptidoglycan biosynthesis protein MviN/MurJ (putative lipid II flippase)